MHSILNPFAQDLNAWGNLRVMRVAAFTFPFPGGDFERLPFFSAHAVCSLWLTASMKGLILCIDGTFTVRAVCSVMYVNYTHALFCGV
jgi:hypothetical protein